MVYLPRQIIGIVLLLCQQNGGMEKLTESLVTFAEKMIDVEHYAVKKFSMLSDNYHDNKNAFQ